MGIGGQQGGGVVSDKKADPHCGVIFCRFGYVQKDFIIAVNSSVTFISWM